MEKASQKEVSTINLWTKPRNQKTKASKDDVLQDIRKLTGRIIDLRALNVSELELLIGSLASKTPIGRSPDRGSKKDYIAFINKAVVLKNSNRLSLEALKALAEELSDKS